MKIRENKVFTCHVLQDKEKRSLSILELIRKKGVISRTDISRATGINVVSVSNYIASFMEKKLVLEKGHAASSGGRKPELVELNAKENCCIGVDVCEDSISAVLMDFMLNIVAKKTAPRPENKRDIAGAVTSLIEDTIRSSSVPTDNIRMIGLSVCCESLLPIRDAVEKKFNIETLAERAATCGAYAERRFNPHAGSGKLLFMHSDLGRGIFIDDEISAGCMSGSFESGTGGAAPADAPFAHADKLKYLNPWDPYLGMAETAKREVSRGVGTKVVSLSGGDIDKITEAVVVDAARQNDETALNIVQSVSITMGLRVAYLVNLFGPGAVVIGGGPEKAQEITFPLIKKMVKRLSLKQYTDTVNIMPSALGDESLCIGAAALAVREVFLNS